MPKSKRNKQVELAKTKKRGFEWKKRLFEEVRSCVDSYANVFVFSVNDMRNSKMKNVREQWKHSRFFIGKNKIMAMALGRFIEEEYKPNLHKLGQQIKGQRGLLFSNKSVEEVLNWFRSYSEGDYARSGNIATETVNLTAGPLTMFPHNLEPYLRQLGLPTSLEKGVIHLIKDHEVCKEGDTLTPETAKILKLLGYEMAEFHITIDCVWSQDGSFMQLTESIDSGSKENVKKEKPSSLGIRTEEMGDSAELEEMEVELDAENCSDDSEDEADNSNSKSILSGILSNNAISNTSTPKEKPNGSCEKETLKLEDDVNRTVADLHEGTKIISEEPVKTVDMQEDAKVAVDHQENTQNDMDLQEDASKTITGCKMGEISEINDNKPSDVNDKRDTKRGRPSNVARTPRVTKTVTKRQSLPKTPDANTSQESPVFRQLRNRSVKVNRKRK